MAPDLAAPAPVPHRRGGRFAAAALATLAFGVTVLGAVATGVGVPSALLRFVAAVAAAGAVGALVVVAFFRTSAAGRSAAPETVAGGRWFAWVWAVAAVSLLLLDVVGEPASATPGIVVAVLAVVVALGCSWTTRWRPVVGLLLLALAGLAPPVVAGRVAGGPDLDTATNALLLHVVAASMWLGVRLTTHGTVTQRYRRFTVACWAVLMFSGAVTALVLVPLTRPFGTALGWLVLVDLAAVAALGVVALRRSRFRPGALVAGVETGVLVVAVAAVTGLVGSPPARTASDPVEAFLGYRLPGAPELLNVLVTWRPDLLLGTAAVVAAALYLAGVRRLRRAGRTWSPARSASWMAGCAVVFLTTSSGVGAYAPAVFSMHMLAHMAMNMVAPLALVLGAPVTLALRALVPARDGKPAGPHEWLLALIDSPVARLLAHPGLAAVAFGGSYYLLYLTGLFETVIGEHWSRTVLNVVILAIGYQFCWVVAGADAAPRRLPHLGRLGVVFAVMPFHVIFAVLLITRTEAVAGEYYRMLGLPWSVDLVADQQLAGVLSLVLGELMLITTQVVLLVQWYRYDQLAGFRSDPGDDDASAYRDMLSTLRRSRGG
ncbi:cytochrome c oxidase assembly protein [Pseudonocardia abyssalis]|uniref:Cytochrome c oxidase assembly protein n=2 Tax=Pseudonocardia abyssalis TaxID=2792008 RepID=A0ABS6UM04_9PSEU|nr:cytochrome c oxidase assembly protein [Pseudonocardia abyssalis]MBW0133257.1 cytochrome c oxidase assembly protein [Pseudonocardia abyssalis]